MRSPRWLIVLGVCASMAMIQRLAFADDRKEHEGCPMCPTSGLHPLQSEEQRAPEERPQSGQMPEHEMMRSMMERMMERGEAHGRRSLSPLELKEELKLTAEQVEALKPIETDYRKVSIKKGADIRVAMVELAALLDQKKPDRNALKQKITEIANLQADLMQYRVEALLKLRDVLSEEQHEKFRTLLKERMKRFRAGGGSTHGMMGGMMPSPQ